MRSIFSYFAFISVFLFLAGCAGESGSEAIGGGAGLWNG
jgi:hypothetical protein